MIKLLPLLTNLRNFSTNRPKRGFTLIEFLVVVSILGILMTLGLANFKTSQKRARDAQRKADLRQYQIALENYASAHNSFYPSIGNILACVEASLVAPGNNNDLCGDYLAPYMSSCPQNAMREVVGQRQGYEYLGGSFAAYAYCYSADPDSSWTFGATAKSWVLWTMLESAGTGANGIWVVCSNGKTGESVGTAETKQQMRGGTCPL